MVLYGGKATKRNTVFKNKTSINTSNINNIIPSNSGRPSPVNQHTSDWRLKDIIPSFETPKAYADEVSTPVEPVPEVTKEYDNWYNKRSANAVTADNTDTSNMSVFDENNPDHIKNSGTKGESGGLFGGYFDHLFTSYDDPSHPNNYKEMEAAAELDKQDDSLPNITPNPDSTFKIKDSLPISEIPVNPKLVNPVKDAVNFGVVDYIANDVQAQYYKLGKDVSKDQHAGALNQQSLYQFENFVQDKFSTLVRTPNALNASSFREIKDLINNSNIPNDDKKRLLKEYKAKKTNYQKSIGSYNTNTPWLFNTSSGRKPNEAETLSLKIADGTITRKELNKWKLLTGQDLPKSGKVTTKDGSMPRILTYKDLF